MLLVVVMLFILPNGFYYRDLLINNFSKTTIFLYLYPY